jgi:hypothetical protein
MSITNASPAPGSFANGLDYFCPNCGVFFSAQPDADHIGIAEFCPYCGEDELKYTIAEILAHCADHFTDPINFYKAFPPDEPIPQSYTGATPRQVDIIISLVAERKRNKLSITVEDIAGPSEFHCAVVEKVFDELHITETGGTK